VRSRWIYRVCPKSQQFRSFPRIAPVDTSSLARTACYFFGAVKLAVEAVRKALPSFRAGIRKNREIPDSRSSHGSEAVALGDRHGVTWEERDQFSADLVEHPGLAISCAAAQQVAASDDQARPRAQIDPLCAKFCRPRIGYV